VEEVMEKKMAEQTERLKTAVNKPTMIGEEESSSEERLSSWASQIPPNLPELPPLSTPVEPLVKNPPPHLHLNAISVELHHPHPRQHHPRLPPIKEDTTEAGPRVQKEAKESITFSRYRLPA
jgi:hypothetical protein